MTAADLILTALAEMTDEQKSAMRDALGLNTPSGPRPPLTVRQAAAELNMPERTVYHMVQTGAVRRVPGTGKVLIPSREVDRLRT